MSSNSVLDFSLAMQKELDDNEHKGGWQDCDVRWLLKRLKQEIGELERAIKKNKPEEDVLSECADVANFAMMISENYEYQVSDFEKE